MWNEEYYLKDIVAAYREERREKRSDARREFESVLFDDSDSGEYEFDKEDWA